MIDIDLPHGFIHRIPQDACTSPNSSSALHSEPRIPPMATRHPIGSWRGPIPTGPPRLLAWARHYEAGVGSYPPSAQPRAHRRNGDGQHHPSECTRAVAAATTTAHAVDCAGAISRNSDGPQFLAQRPFISNAANDD